MAFMQWARRMALVLVGCAGLWGAAQAQDMAGAKDHPAVKRFGGSSIVGYEVRNFDAVEFRPPPSRSSTWAPGCGAMCSRRCSSKAS